MADQIDNAKKPQPSDEAYQDLLEYSLLLAFITLATIVVTNNIDHGVRAVWLNVSHALAAAHLLAS